MNSMYRPSSIVTHHASSIVTITSYSYSLGAVEMNRKNCPRGGCPRLAERLTAITGS